MGKSGITGSIHKKDTYQYAEYVLYHSSCKRSNKFEKK